MSYGKIPQGNEFIIVIFQQNFTVQYETLPEIDSANGVMKFVQIVHDLRHISVARSIHKSRCYHLQYAIPMQVKFNDFLQRFLFSHIFEVFFNSAGKQNL